MLLVWVAERKKTTNIRIDQGHRRLQFSLWIFGGWWIQKVILDMTAGDLEMAITLWFPRGSPQRQRWFFRRRDLTTCNGKRRLRNPCLLLSVIYCNLIRYHGCMHQKGDKQPQKWHLLTSTAWGGWLLQNSLVFPSLIPRWIPRFAGEAGGEGLIWSGLKLFSCYPPGN